MKVFVVIHPENISLSQAEEIQYRNKIANLGLDKVTKN